VCPSGSVSREGHSSQFHDAIQRRVVERTLEANNLKKLKDLVANFKAVIQAHDAKVADAQAALSAHESLAMESVDGMHASFPASPSFSTEIPSSGATKGNTNGTEGNTNANSQLGAVDVHKRHKNPALLYISFDSSVMRFKWCVFAE
jgi:hypothetical protein